MIRKQLIPVLAFSSLCMTACMQESFNTDVNSKGEVELSICPVVEESASRADDAAEAYKGSSMSVTLWYQHDNHNEEYNKKFVKYTNQEGSWKPEDSNNKIFLKKGDGTDKTKFSLYVTAPFVPDPQNDVTNISDNENFVTNVLKNQEFSIKEDQNSGDNFTLSDLASYNAGPLDPNAYPDGKITVNLTHRLSLLKINVVLEDGVQGEVTDVKVKSKTTVKFNTKYKPVPELQEGDVEDITPLSKDGEFHVILPPQTVTNREFISLKVGERDYLYTVPAGLEHNLVHQKSHKLTLKVGKNGISFGGITVEDWEPKTISLHKERNGFWQEETIQPTNNVYEVRNGGQLYYALNHVAKKQTVRLMNDIDLSAHYWMPIGKIGDAINEEQHITIDGNNKTITGLCIDATQEIGSINYACLFNETRWCVIKDMVIDSPELIGSENIKYAGIFIGNSFNTGIYNCIVKNATISGNFLSAAESNIGGLAGSISSNSAIVGCVFQGNISAKASSTSSSVGGLVGKAGVSNVVACYSDCNFTDITAKFKGLFSGKRGGGGTSVTEVASCIYVGTNTGITPLGTSPNETTYICNSCTYNNINTELTLTEYNDAIDGVYEKYMSNIMYLLEDKYKYHFIDNPTSDEKYKYIVTNTVGQ